MIHDNLMENDRRIIKDNGYCRMECEQTEISKLIQSLDSF